MNEVGFHSLCNAHHCICSLAVHHFSVLIFHFVLSEFTFLNILLSINCASENLSQLVIVEFFRNQDGRKDFKA
jgi:hypothetical protein